MPKVLFSRPNHDDTVAYLYVFSKELVDFAMSKQFQCFNEEEKDANKKIVSSILSKQKPELIMFNGHGSPKIICGHKDEPLIIAGENQDLLNSAIIYSLSCSSAIELGPKSVESGARAFIGYLNDFALGMDVDSQCNPRKDKRAKLFLEPSNLLFKSLLKGNTVNFAVARAKQDIEKNISILRTDSSLDAPSYIPYLYWNYLNLAICGNENSSI